MNAVIIHRCYHCDKDPPATYQVAIRYSPAIHLLKKVTVEPVTLEVESRSVDE